MALGVSSAPQVRPRWEATDWPRRRTGLPERQHRHQHQVMPQWGSLQVRLVKAMALPLCPQGIFREPRAGPRTYTLPTSLPMAVVTGPRKHTSRASA